MLYSGIVLWAGSEWFSGCSEHTWERFQQCGRSVKEKEGDIRAKDLPDWHYIY